MPKIQSPQGIAPLFSQPTSIRLAIEITLLVFIRSSELRFARWSEIDVQTAMWTISADSE